MRRTFAALGGRSASWWRAYANRRERRLYREDANRLFGRMSGNMTPARKALISEALGDMDDAGILAKLDLFYCLAAHNAQSARLNWVSATFPMIVTAAPVFTADRGYAGDGVSARLDVGAWTPVKAVQDSTTLGLFVRTAATYDGVASRYGLYTGPSRLVRRPTTEANIEWRVNDGSNANTAVAGQTGHFAIRRTASNERSIWRNGAQVATSSQASSGNGSRFDLFHANGSGFGDQQVSIAYAGAALSDQEMADMHTIITALKTGIGF